MRRCKAPVNKCLAGDSKVLFLESQIIYISYLQTNRMKFVDPSADDIRAK